ncbi:unnamed protein product [Ostreobium quekettii]|uniref:Uncharacterized protein n=1 Tax=Ostreobium quekettii TaxID=121088 RepID=A0A8S1JA02_9CHLO|nr:unnamed protein product [Ostreobium quekettii]|eukprot:evm.model.scf_2260.3 EVM.evm.TU.scf_2260.3   scf_2260:17768-18136(-)
MAACHTAWRCSTLGTTSTRELLPICFERWTRAQGEGSDARSIPDVFGCQLPQGCGYPSRYREETKEQSSKVAGLLSASFLGRSPCGLSREGADGARLGCGSSVMAEAQCMWCLDARIMYDHV